MFHFLKKTARPSKAQPAANFITSLVDNDDLYLRVYTAPVKMMSVFDDIRFDRSDIDNLSPGMYRHVDKTLAKQGFKRVSGRTFEHQHYDIKGIIPKSRVQGSSPFHVLDYTPKRDHDFYILTPTQAASVIITLMSHEQAVPQLVELAKTHPFNIFKLKDHIDSSQNHNDYLKVIPHLKYTQREAISQPPLKRLKSLK